MSPRSAPGAYILVCLVLAARVGAAQGQIRFLPNSEFDQANIRLPQAIVSRVNAMRQSNDFERLSAFKEDSRYRVVGRPIGRLKIRVRDQSGRTGTALCTAAILSERYLLTNFHCIPGIVGVTDMEAKVEMEYLSEQEAGRIQSFSVDVQPAEADERLDYAILRVQGNPAARYGHVTIARESPQVQDTIFVIGYPEGQPETLSRKGCSVKVTQSDEFVHSCDTLGGSSGSPIFSDNTLQMIGLHFAGGEEGNYGKSMSALIARSAELRALAVAAPTQLISDQSTTTSISLASNPEGAVVVFQQVLLGVTPLTIRVSAANEFRFILKKPGYENEPIVLSGSGFALSKRTNLRPASAQGRSKTTDGQQSPGFDPVRDQWRHALEAWDELEKVNANDVESNLDQSPSMSEDAVRAVEESLRHIGKSKSR